MKRKIGLIIFVLLFAGAAAAQTSSDSISLREMDIGTEDLSDEEVERLRSAIRDAKVSEASASLKSVVAGEGKCVILSEGSKSDGSGTDHAWGGNAALVCPGEGLEHTDDWVEWTTRAHLAGDPPSNQSWPPRFVNLVLDADNCPGDQVCYRVEGRQVTVQPVNDPPVVERAPVGIGNGVQWPYNLTGQPATLAMVEYGSSTSERAAYPPIGIAVNASVPKGTVYSEPPAADCDDQDPDVRPSESDGKLCGTTTHFLDPDSDGDGFGDLTVAETGNELEWRVDDETVAKAETDVIESVGGNIIILNVEGARERPELVEAIASKSGLSKADSKKALDSFIYISMKVAYDEIDKSSPYIAKGRAPSDEVDKATPEINKGLSNETELRSRIAELGAELAVKENRIDELESRLQDLEGGEVSGSENGDKQGDDSVVRKRPGEAAEGNDADSDADGLGDATEEETDEPVRRPGFVNRLLGSIFR